MSLLDNTDRLKSKAIKLKAEYNYSDAAEAFNELANSATDNLEISDAFDNAGKCYKLSGQFDKAKDCWFKAIKVYSKTLRNIKCAQILHSIFEITNDTNEKISLLERMIEQYELADDSRAESIKEELAQLFSEAEQFDKSTMLWEYLALNASKDPIMTFRANNFMLYALLSSIGLNLNALQGDSKGKENKRKGEEEDTQNVLNTLNKYSWIRRDGDTFNLITTIINGLNGKISSEETLERVNKIFSKIPSPPQWCMNIWERCIEEIDKRECDIT